jgi:hypothetical protein
MGKEGEVTTEIVLAGIGVKRFLDRRGISDLERDSSGNYVVARFVDGEKSAATQFGNLSIEHRLVNDERNREVVIFGNGLRNRGSKAVRRVSLRHDSGSGFQHFSKNMQIGVRTNAGADVFVRDK